MEMTELNTIIELMPDATAAEAAHLHRLNDELDILQEDGRLTEACNKVLEIAAFIQRVEDE